MVFLGFPDGDKVPLLHPPEVPAHRGPRPHGGVHGGLSHGEVQFQVLDLVGALQELLQDRPEKSGGLGFSIYFLNSDPVKY